MRRTNETNNAMVSELHAKGNANVTVKPQEQRGGGGSTVAMLAWLLTANGQQIVSRIIRGIRALDIHAQPSRPSTPRRCE